MKRTAAIAAIAFSLFATSAHAIVISQTGNATTLVNNIIGPGIVVVGTPTFQGAATQGGTFSSGSAEVGFSSGIVLHTGNVNEIPGANSNTGTETRGVGSPGNNSLDVSVGSGGTALIPSSFDAAVLSFEFQFGDGSIGGDVNFAFTFASEEYIDFIGTQFNDAFVLLIDGVNVGLVGGVPVTINTVNDVINSAFYVNNVANTNGIPNANRAIEFDGLTTTLIASALNLGSGTHTATFAVADVGDSRLDAAVFIQAGSFSPNIPTNDVPLPATLPLMATAFAGLGFIGWRRRRTG